MRFRKNRYFCRQIQNQSDENKRSIDRFLGTDAPATKHTGFTGPAVRVVIRSFIMSIIASGITYRHPDSQPLFEDMTFSVPDGAKISLIGPNGVGKSTLLQLLAGG